MRTKNDLKSYSLDPQRRDPNDVGDPHNIERLLLNSIGMMPHQSAATLKLPTVEVNSNQFHSIF